MCPVANGTGWTAATATAGMLNARQAAEGGSQCTGTDGKRGLPSQAHSISLLFGSHTGTAIHEATQLRISQQSGTKDANTVTHRFKEEVAGFYRSKRQ